MNNYLTNIENNKKEKKENIWNLPNFLTLLRVFFAFVAVFLILKDFHIIYIVVAFVFGMFTDFLDGWSARKLNLRTEFGRQFDMVADRIIVLSTVLVFVFKFGFAGFLTASLFFQLFFMISREILSLPMGLFSIFKRMKLPQVKMIGKITTLVQSVSIPLVFLSAFYPFFGFSIFFAFLSGILGIISSIVYYRDMREIIKNNNKYSA